MGPEAVTITGNTIGGAQAGDYTVTQQTGLTQTVTAKALNYTGISAASKAYDGTATAALSGTAATLPAEAPGGSTSDGAPYTGDTVSFTTGTLTGVFASQDVANGIAVTVTGWCDADGGGAERRLFGGVAQSGSQGEHYAGGANGGGDRGAEQGV